jgi:hypothetical protein
VDVLHLLLQYIQCLRKAGNIEKLRMARENMNMYFPLTPKMWQDWAKDEISLSTRSAVLLTFIHFATTTLVFNKSKKEMYLNLPKQ